MFSPNTAVYAPIRNSERVKISSEDEVNSAILTKMSGQIQNEMTPELMAKIKRLILEELSSMKMSEPKVSHRGNISPSAAIRTFTSRVRNMNE
uniref:Uncharacterized protein n=1 Tax=Heterorhabditis bacteriophora TaxID=37862 RepID=A0A1I7XLL8_HETBA